MKSSAHIGLLWPAAPAILALTAYIPTLAPSLAAFDSGELAAAAWTFGIPQPTGYPLLILLGGAWAHLLPFGTAIYRLNLSAAFTSAAALFVFAQLVLLLLRVGRPSCSKDTSTTGGPAAAADADPSGITFASLTAIFGATFALAFSHTWWRSSLSFSQAPLFMLLLALLLWSTMSAVYDDRLTSGARRRRGMLTAFLLGLSFAHSSAIAVILPSMAVMFVSRLRGFGTALRSTMIAAPLFLLGLSPVLTIFLRSGSADYVWGEPGSIAGFLDHITARGASALALWTSGSVELQLTHIIDTFPEEFGYLLFPFLLTGIIFSFRRMKIAAAAIALIVLSSSALACAMFQYEIGMYLLPLFPAAALWLAFGIHAVITSKRAVIRVAGVLLLCIGLVHQGVSAYSSTTEHDNHMAEDYILNVFHSMKPGTLLLTEEWHFTTSPSLYLQKVEKMRTDVDVADVRLLRKPWYIKKLMSGSPEIFKDIELSAYEYFREYKQAKQGSTDAAARLTAMHAAMIRNIVRTASAVRPVCFTAGMEAWMPATHAAVPEGMVVRAYPEESVPSPDEPVFDDFVFQRPTRSDDYLRSLEHRYFRQLAERGFWLWAQGRKAEADAYFERASEYRQFSASDRWRAWALLSRSRDTLR